MAKPQKVHFIGICGVAMSAVAIALAKKGWKVTGSDSGFFPPVSTNLTKLGIPYYPGFHPEKMVAEGAPDLVIVGNATASKNPELLYVKEHGIPFKSYPEAMGEFLIRPKSIVAAGTYGKTMSSALLSHILKESDLKPSYMFGGVAQSGMPAAVIDDGDWSVVEGDEYMTAKWDKQAKFMHYRPTHLLLTAVKWDHADVYPTEESYFDAFKKLISMSPFIVACIDTEKLPALLSEAKHSYISYGKDPRATYRYENVSESKDGIEFDIIHEGSSYHIKSPILGTYNAENITGCFAMAKEIGIDADSIMKSIASFAGMKRRLEKRYENKVTIIDDIAHSAEKVRSVLATLHKAYKGSIVAVYEPNSGNRTPQSKPAYENAFKDADTVIIPRLTKLKIDEANPEKMFDGQELRDTIAKTHKNAVYMEDDKALVDFITKNRKEGDVIAFLGSHGFRGMIEESITSLRRLSQ